MATSNPWLSACFGQVTPFGHAVDRLLDSWTALQLVVANEAGGQDSAEKAKWMVFAIENWFKENENIQPDELEDFLGEIFENEFEDVIIDDCSTSEIARKVCLFYRLCSEGQMAELEAKLQHLPKAAVDCCLAGPSQVEMDGEEEMDASESEQQGPPKQPLQQQQQQPNERPVRNEPDEDGWTTIPVRGKGRRK